MLWESTADLTAPTPPNQATELIEYPPTHQMTTDIKATTDGTHTSQTLADHDLTFKPINVVGNAGPS